MIALDSVERQWHAGVMANAVTGDEVEDWTEVRTRFDEWLEAPELPETDESKMMRLLGLK